MTTLFYSHLDFLKHGTGAGHPENKDRLVAIKNALHTPEFSPIIHLEAPLAINIHELVSLVHPTAFIDAILEAVPTQGFNYIDADTVLSPGSGKATLRAVSAACSALDQIMANQATQAFCAVRPPGHHAEPERAMGFCLFNTIAITAEYARQHHQLERIAIVDFDVHHGNGTQMAFYDQPNILYISSHEMPNFPGTGFASETGLGNIINVPLHPGTTGAEFRTHYQQTILPALRTFKPELLLISAGFDAHRDDPLSSIQLVEDDYAWLGQELLEIVDTYCNGKLLSVLEGGYHLPALAASVAAYIGAML